VNRRDYTNLRKRIGSKSAVAKLLQINFSTLYRRETGRAQITFEMGLAMRKAVEMYS
jgi:hypothetical protein